MTDDRKVAQRYRELGAEEPPRALDEAILAAARREAGAGPAGLLARSGRQRWYAPLATAAVLVLAVAVTLHTQRERPELESPVPVAPPPTVAKDQVQEVAKSEVAKAGTARPESPKSAPVPQLARSAPAAREPQPFAAQPGKELAAANAQASGAARAPARREASADSVERADHPMAQARMQALKEAVTPERDLERIADLRAQGRHEDADKALAEFRKRYPEFRIPAAMLERVERR
jgi:hypothetical protein